MHVHKVCLAPVELVNRTPSPPFCNLVACIRQTLFVLNKFRMNLDYICVDIVNNKKTRVDL